MSKRTHQNTSYTDDGEYLSRAFYRESITIVEPQDEASKTGLLDQHGNPLLRKPKPKRPIGFLHAYEQDGSK